MGPTVFLYFATLYSLQGTCKIYMFESLYIIRENKQY